MVHTLPVKVKSTMLNIAEQLGIRNARRNGLRPHRTRNNSRGSSAEETAAGQCRRLAGHGPVSITGEETRAGGNGWRYKAIALTTWNGWVRILGGSRQSADNPLQLNAGFAILRTADLGCWRDQGLRSLRRQCVQPAWRHPHYVHHHNAIRQCSWERGAGAQGRVHIVRPMT